MHNGHEKRFAAALHTTTTELVAAAHGNHVHDTYTNTHTRARTSATGRLPLFWGHQVRCPSLSASPSLATLSTRNDKISVSAGRNNPLKRAFFLPAFKARHPISNPPRVSIRSQSTTRCFSTPTIVPGHARMPFPMGDGSVFVAHSFYLSS